MASHSPGIVEAGVPATKPHHVAGARPGRRGTEAGLILATSILQAGGWIAAETAVATIAPLTLAALRFIVAGLILVAIARWRGSSFGTADWRTLLALAVIGVAFSHAILYAGLRLAPAADGVVLSTALTPAFVAVLAMPLLRERIPVRGLAGVAVSAGGVSLIVLDAGSGGSGGDRLLGDVFVIGGVLATALYTILGRVALRSGSPLGVVGSTTLVGGFVLAPFALIEGAIGIGQPWSSDVWLAFIYLTVPSAGLSAVMYYTLVRGSGAARASLVGYLVPVIVLGWSAVGQGEPLSVARLGGALLAVVGVHLVLAGSTGHSSPGSARALPP